MMEILRGIRQIKGYAWEGAFAARVRRERRRELAALAVRKYLDVSVPPGYIVCGPAYVDSGAAPQARRSLSSTPACIPCLVSHSGHADTCWLPVLRAGTLRVLLVSRLQEIWQLLWGACTMMRHCNSHH